jgi:hypothetical protein
MSGFNKKEKAEEAKFIHGEEIDFKVSARRNKLLGLWVVERIGLTGKDAESYAIECIEADFMEPGSEDVVRKVKADLENASSDVSEQDLRNQMSSLEALAREQIEGEAPG